MVVRENALEALRGREPRQKHHRSITKAQRKRRDGVDLQQVDLEFQT